MPPELANINFVSFEVPPALIDKRPPFSWTKPTAQGAEGTLLLDCKVSRGVLAPFLSDLLGR